MSARQSQEPSCGGCESFSDEFDLAFGGPRYRTASELGFEARVVDGDLEVPGEVQGIPEVGGDAGLRPHTDPGRSRRRRP